jgi:hypothetical protein
MRVTATPAQGFEAKSYSGTHTILVALNCTEERRKGLMGFAFEREMVGPGDTGPKWLRSQKVFKSIVPDPKSALDPNDPRKSQRFSTKDFPIQSFLWGDYTAAPGTAYRFRIVPMYGKPGALTSDPKDELKLEIETEKEWEEGAGHGVWFNRGAIASQKFAEAFGNAPPKNIDDPTDPEALARPPRSVPELHQGDACQRRSSRCGVRIHLRADPCRAQAGHRPWRRRPDRLSRHERCTRTAQ